MKLRRGSTAEQGLQELEGRRTKLASEIEQAEAALEQAAGGVADATRLAATAHLDGGDIDAAAKARQEAEARRDTIAGSLEILREAIIEQDRRLEVKRDELRAEQLAAAEVELARALSRRTEASEAFATARERAIGAARELVTARDAVTPCRDKVSELGGDRFEQDADEVEWDADEVEWGDVTTLLELLSSKPIRPLAEREQSRRQADVDAVNAVRRERIRVLDETRRFAALSWPRPGEQERKVEQFFAQVPADLLDEARALYETTRDEILHRSRARV